MKKILLALLGFIAVILLAIFLYFQLSTCGISPWSCGDYSTQQDRKTLKISVGEGPEDMAIDTSTSKKRIIVSCSSRRNTQQKPGGFYQINTDNGVSNSMNISPADLKIYPHGIDVVMHDGATYLYAISHHNMGDSMEHKIFRFLIQEDSLIQDQDYVLSDELLTGPNDIDVLEDGSFFVSNPMPSDDPIESTKAILGIKEGTVLHYNGKAKWTTVLKDMCYPNGVWFDEKSAQLVVANGGCKAVERFTINHTKAATDKRYSTADHGIDIPIGDNLMMDEKGVLWTAAHPCPLKFLGHAQDSNEKSPIQIFGIDPVTMKAKLVFQNNGDMISAASTALRIDNRLFISQVFDPFVLMIDDIDF